MQQKKCRVYRTYTNSTGDIVIEYEDGSTLIVKPKQNDGLFGQKCY